jgi:hypothetical protein
MRSFAIALAAALATSSLAAQAQPDAAQNGPQNPPIKSPDANSSSVPVKGANSFTRRQAQARIEAKGYTKLAGLHKDHAGVWRAHAEKDGKPASVSLDYQGNVN